MTPDSGPFFHKILTLASDPIPKEKRRILLESTPALRIHGHLYRKQISDLQIQHIPLTSQTHSCVAKRNRTVMVMIIPTTILNDKAGKTILNEKVGYHFCQVILLFELRQKVIPYTKYEI